MQTRRIFRLFLSSTFSDFIAEREALQLHVYPELERYCAMSGAHFQAVDLRWGITEEAQREHDTMRICLEEIRRCQQLSPRPNFAVLLGDRYGWEPVPAVIPQAHWRKLKAAALPEHWSLIKDSYRVDSNAIPPVYRLHTSGRDVSLLASLRCAAKSFRGHVRLPYFASATHQEIVLGALTNKDENNRKLNPNEHVHVYVRHLKDLPQDDTAKDFIDWDEAAQKPVPGARDRLRGLETKLRRKLGDNVHDLHADWQHHGRNGAVDQTYIQHFCDAFLAHQKALIDAELASGKLADDRQLRDEAHRDFGADRARVFAGRGTLLTQISKHTAAVLQAQPAQSQRSGLTAPLILLGAGGSGKSALLAKAAQLDRERTKGTGVVIFERYIGGVPGTESLMNTLTALTADIAHIYDQPEPAVPENAKGLAKTFLQVMGNASEKRPLQIYLDALDQLDSTDSAWMLDWLPAKLPPHVSMVVSARTDTDVERSARRRYPQSLLTVPAMKPSEGLAMLKLWLADKRSAWFNAGIAPTRGRRLTTIQQESLLKAFNHNGSALWLKLAYEEASSWTSRDAPRDLPTDIHGLIEDLIDRRLIKHENHPKVFTERALAYLTAGRFGLSEAELGRALGTDTDVRAEFIALEKTQHKWNDNQRLPPILWSRLYFDLEPYLGKTVVDGTLLIRWFHREFADVMKRRFLRHPQDRAAIHGALANTFQAMERELRPEETNDDALFRSTDVTGMQVSAALRRVTEQPWQLAQGGMHKELQTLLTNFGFLLGKCAAGAVHDLETDCDVARLSHVSRLLRTNRHLLNGSGLDDRWPRHRVMLQLALEEYPPRELHSAASEWLKSGQASWVVTIAPRQTPTPSSILLVAGDQEATRLMVYQGTDDRIFVTPSAGRPTLAFDEFTGIPLGHVDDIPLPDSKLDAQIDDFSKPEPCLIWAVGRGRWFRWRERRHGGGKDGTASLFVPTLGWINLPRAHHHSVWHASELQGGGFATLGINSNIGVLVVWDSEYKAEIISIPHGPSFGDSHGIVELDDGSLLIWPFMNDGSCAHLERTNNAFRWRVRSLPETAGTCGALPIRSIDGIGRVVIWTTKGEVRLWRMADLPEGLTHRSVPLGKSPSSPSHLRRSSIPWGTTWASREVEKLWRDANGMLIAQTCLNDNKLSPREELWRWAAKRKESSLPYWDFNSVEKNHPDLEPIQEALHIPSLFTQWFSWKEVVDSAIRQARENYTFKGHRSNRISPPTIPTHNEKDFMAWVNAVIGLIDDSNRPDPYYSSNRQRSLLTAIIESMAHLFPFEPLSATLQADQLLRAQKLPADPTENPLWRLLRNDIPNHEVFRSSIALHYSVGREAALEEAERLYLKHPHSWFLEVSRAILQPLPDMEMLVIASRIFGCPPLYRRTSLVRSESFGAWELIQNGRQGIWVCEHPNDLKFFSAPEGLLIAGELSEGIRQFRFID